MDPEGLLNREPFDGWPSRRTGVYAEAQIPVAVQQVAAALDTPGSNHSIDGLADGHAEHSSAR